MDLQQNPFADLIPNQPPPPQPAQPYTVGRPDPIRQAQDQREAERLRIAQSAEARQAASDRLAAERARLQIQQEQRTAADPAGDAPATQRRDAGFYLRAGRANGLYEQHQVEPRGVVGQTLADAFPRIANANADPERQMAEAAQADFIGATLRYESGAAVPPAEFEMQRARYFPQPGDSPEVIAFKATLRRNAIEALQRSAGPAANGIDPSLPRDQMSPNGQVGAGVLDAGVAALHGSGPQGPTPSPGAPPDPNRVQPGESMGQVGTLPIPVNSDPNGHNVVSGEGGTVLTENDRHIAGMATALANSHLPPDQAIAQINNILRANGRNLLSPGDEESIRSARRNHTRHPGFSATPSGQSQGNLISRLGDTAGGAAVINYLDSASLGLPGLLSGDYREGVAAVREAHPVASTVGTIAGGLVAPGGPRPGMGLGAQTIRSGGQGLIYGLNESGGDPESALAGGAIGLAAPSAFNLAARAGRPVANALTSTFRRGPVSAEQNALAQALTDEGIPGSRPLLDPSRRDRMAYLESSVGSGGPIRQGLNATRGGIEERAGRLGAGGTAEEAGTMGERVQDAGRRYIDQSRTQATRLYDRAADLAGDVPVRAEDAVAEIDLQIGQLQRNPNSNAGEIRFLESLRNDFVDENGSLRPKTVADIRDIRTGLRGRIAENNLTFSRVEARVMDILDRARGDIERDLGGAIAPAVKAYRRADEFYARRAAEIRQVVQRVIGSRDNPLSGEQVMARIRTMASARGDIGRLKRMMAHFTPEERADIAATIAENAGRRSADEPFSPAHFVAWARTLSPRAQAAFFGEEGAQSIQNLSRISQALDATQKRLNNSRSGLVANWRGWLRDLTGGGPVGFVAGVAGGGSATTSGLAGAAIGSAAALTGLAIRRLSAKALMSTDLSRWLAAAPRATTAQAVRTHIGRLSAIAARSPAISQEITGLRQALMNAMNDNVPLQAVASDQERQNNQ